MSKTKTKVIDVTDEQRATTHSWMITQLEDVDVAKANYRDKETIYTRLAPGINKSSHDLYKLKSEVPLTGAEHRFLWDTDFEDLEDGESYTVNGHK